MKNPLKFLGDLAARLAGARRAIDDLHAADKELRQMAEDVAADRARLLSSPPPAREVMAGLAAEVDALGAEWRQRWSSYVVNAGRPEEITLAPGSRLAAVIGNFDLSTVCGLIPDALKAGLAAVVNGASFEEGPPLGERPQLLAELEAKLADVEARHTELADHARELGISIELLPEVRMRRAHEATLAESREREAHDLVRKVRS